MLSGTKSNQVAHYYCELAEAARARGDRELARSYLKNTIRSETGQLRGALIRAGIAQEEREITQAIALYEQVIEKEHTFITEVLPPLVECYRTIDKLPYLDAKIENWVAADPTLRRDFAYAAIIANLTSSDALNACVESFVLGNPVLASLVNGENRIEAVLVESAGKAGLWRIDLTPSDAIVEGSLRVISGEALLLGASSATFRLGGHDGERIVFTFLKK